MELEPPLSLTFPINPPPPNFWKNHVEFDEEKSVRKLWGKIEM